MSATGQPWAEMSSADHLAEAQRLMADVGVNPPSHAGFIERLATAHLLAAQVQASRWRAGCGADE